MTPFDALAPLDPLDAQLVHALQIAPRAPWSRLSPVLGVDAVTVARRWEQLRTDGRAWVTAYPGPPLQRRMGVALIEVDCYAGQLEPVTEALCALPRVATVEHMAGGRDLLLTVFTPDLGELGRLLQNRIGVLPGVVSTRAQMTTRIFGEGSRWRLRALSEQQQLELAETASAVRGRTRDGASPRLPDGVERTLMAALSDDGRLGPVELAARTGLGRGVVRSRLGRLIDDRELAFRCEVARDLTEWPVSATLWARVPADRLEATARSIVSLPEVRLCASVTGPHNLVITVWLRSVGDVQRLEAQLAERLPQLTLLDRAIALSQVKLMGRRIGPGGRGLDAVPLDVWGNVPGA
ncbi:Lrp/AsnC family transcriptional regulator [Streptomyces sp. NPDC087440]|uniref:Lrp/AsnC family transcriptional regulator n=1 Tax=Streptomyces sp. NPDC087440 TaxID=3365790 RepID=UPI00380E2F1B